MYARTSNYTLAFFLDFRDHTCSRWMIILIFRTCITSGKVIECLNSVLQNHCLRRCYLDDKYLAVSTYRCEMQLGHICLVKGKKTLVKWGVDNQALVASEYRWMLIFQYQNNKQNKSWDLWSWWSADTCRQPYPLDGRQQSSGPDESPQHRWCPAGGWGDPLRLCSLSPSAALEPGRFLVLKRF